MSWFEAAGLTSLARSALKEAQRTIDKALDIQENESSSSPAAIEGVTSAKLKEESDNFFAEFGITENKKLKKSDSPTEDVSPITAPIAPLPVSPPEPSLASSPAPLPTEVKEAAVAPPMVSSLWGSFTGSFFDESSSKKMASQPGASGRVVAAQPLLSATSRTPTQRDEGDKPPPPSAQAMLNQPSLNQSSVDTLATNSDEGLRTTSFTLPTFSQPVQEIPSNFTEPRRLSTDSSARDSSNSDAAKLKTEDSNAKDDKHPEQRAQDSISTKESFNSIFSSSEQSSLPLLVHSNTSDPESSFLQFDPHDRSSTAETMSRLVEPLADSAAEGSEEGAGWAWGWESGDMLSSTDGADPTAPANELPSTTSDGTAVLTDSWEDHHGFTDSQLVVTTEDETLDTAINRSSVERVDTAIDGWTDSDGVDCSVIQVRNTQAGSSPSVDGDSLQDPSQTNAASIPTTSSEVLPATRRVDDDMQRNSQQLTFNTEMYRHEAKFVGEYSRLEEKNQSSCSSDSNSSRRSATIVIEHRDNSLELAQDISDSSVSKSETEHLYTDKLGLSLKLEENSSEIIEESLQEQQLRASDTSSVGVIGSTNSSCSLPTSTSSSNSSSRPSPASFPGGATPSPAPSNEATPSSSHSSGPAPISTLSSVAPCSSDSFAVITSSSCSTSPSVEVLSDSYSLTTSPTDTSLTDTSTRHETIVYSDDVPQIPSAAAATSPTTLMKPSEKDYLPATFDNKLSTSHDKNVVSSHKQEDGSQRISTSSVPVSSFPSSCSSSGTKATLPQTTGVPLTVQPSKSPLKISSLSTVIDSQVTSSGDPHLTCRSVAGSNLGEEDEDAGDQWCAEGGSSSSNPILTTPVESLTPATITRQPLARALASDAATAAAATPLAVLDAQQWDSFSEDVSASESLHSASSSHTVVEGGGCDPPLIVEALEVQTSLDAPEAPDQVTIPTPGITASSCVAAEVGGGLPRMGTSQTKKMDVGVVSEVRRCSYSDCQISTPISSSDTGRANTLAEVVSSSHCTFSLTEDLSSDQLVASVEGTVDKFLDPSPRSRPESESGGSVCTIVGGGDPASDGGAAGSLLPLVPLDVSVESGGSSDTITTSMDSSQLLLMTASSGGDVVQGLEDRWEERVDIPSSGHDGNEASMDLLQERVPLLLQEAMLANDRSSHGPPAGDAGDAMASWEVTAEGSKHPQTLHEIADKDESSKSTYDEEEIRVQERRHLSRTVPESEREQSPSSSDSLNSEMVKIGSSEHTSGHTSGDEFETTTSSDIEVISSPSLDGVSVYSGGGGVALLGPAHNTASRVWHSAQQRLKSFLVDPNAVGGVAGRPGPNGTNPQDRAEMAISPSMTASFTSISESDAGSELWGTGGCGSSSPPNGGRQRRGDGSQHYFERGHTRNQSNLSETSESSSEPHTPEVEKLSKRIAHLSEVVDAREMRALELSQQNASLLHTNNALQQRVQELESNGGGEEGTAEAIREEFTQRLVTMERKFQQALREKEAAQKQLESARTESASRLSTSEVRLQLEERDIVIAELRHEGEKLSKQQLHYSNTIKKLRAKEKELEATTASQSAKVESQHTEIERQHKQLLAKSEVERRQVSAITQLTAERQQMDELLRTVRAEAAETEGKMVVLREALDTAYRELGEAKRQESSRVAQLAEQSLSAEVGAKQQLTEALKQLQRQTDREKEALHLQLEELQLEKDRVQHHADRTEREVRAELNAVQRQLSDSEGRGEQLSMAVAAATRPLLRQIEALQASHANHRHTWEELEAHMAHRLQEAEKQAAVSSERERSVREQSSEALAQKAALQAQVEHVRGECSALAAKVQSLTAALSSLEEQKHSALRESTEAQESLSRELKTARAECDSVKSQLDLERTALSAERKRCETLQQHIAAADKKAAESGAVSRQSSPTPSLSRLSMAGSLYSGAAGHWQDDVFDSGSVVWGGGVGPPSLYEALRGNTATTVEALTSQLTQREGEVHHLQSELTRHEAQRDSLATELLQLTGQVQQLQQQMDKHQQLQSQHQDVQQKYNALLQMYGEKVEEVEELRLDLSDVKEMYKAQINQLMQK